MIFFLTLHERTGFLLERDHYQYQHRYTIVVLDRCFVDKIVFVEAPVELCIERATKRDNTNKIDIINRINKQPSHSDIVRFSNYVICNDGKKDNDIEMQVKNIIDNIF